MWPSLEKKKTAPAGFPPAGTFYQVDFFLSVISPF